MNIKYVVQNNNGFIGYLRINGGDHEIFEGHPTVEELTDLRLYNPF